VSGFNLLNVARLAKEKDQATLFRAVALAAREVKDLTLWLVGGGARREELDRLARELDISSRIVFLGERKWVGNYLRQAHVFVLSSKTEGLPISLLESMAAGLPSIVTDVGGMPEIVRLSGAGQIVPNQNAAALARTIVEYSTRRDLLRELGRRARECYEKYFTPERMAEAYLDLYRKTALP
jgi:glycosyltransferase involved in cell wall biosynthesis